MAEQFLTYNGRPLVRGGNTIYYGNMSDEYVCVLQILTEKEENDKNSYWHIFSENGLVFARNSVL